MTVDTLEETMKTSATVNTAQQRMKVCHNRLDFKARERVDIHVPFPFFSLARISSWRFSCTIWRKLLAMEEVVDKPDNQYNVRIYALTGTKLKRERPYSSCKTELASVGSLGRRKSLECQL